MIKHAEMNADAARERVAKTATAAEAAEYLYREVGLRVIQLLAQKTGLQIRENSILDRRWCERLAERLRPPCGARVNDGGQNTCTRSVGHDKNAGEDADGHRCKAADVDARLRGNPEA